MLIVDAGVLYASADRSDSHYWSCRNLLQQANPPLIVPELVLTEVAYLLGSRLGAKAELALVQSISNGQLLVEPVLDSEWQRLHELMATYLDLPLGLADAALVALTERYQVETVASIDHRHIGVVRPSHMAALTLVPELAGRDKGKSGGSKGA